MPQTDTHIHRLVLGIGNCVSSLCSLVQLNRLFPDYEVNFSNLTKSQNSYYNKTNSAGKLIKQLTIENIKLSLPILALPKHNSVTCTVAKFNM